MKSWKDEHAAGGKGGFVTSLRRERLSVLYCMIIGKRLVYPLDWIVMQDNTVSKLCTMYGDVK